MMGTLVVRELTHFQSTLHIYTPMMTRCNVYKFSETTYDYEVTYGFNHFLFKNKTWKDVLQPMNLTMLWLNTGKFFGSPSLIEIMTKFVNHIVFQKTFSHVVPKFWHIHRTQVPFCKTCSQACVNTLPYWTNLHNW